MTLLLVLLFVVLLAVLAPRYGVDSRGLTDREGGPPDLFHEVPPGQPPDLPAAYGRPEPAGLRQ
jgi:hypothetical protein